MKFKTPVVGGRWLAALLVAVALLGLVAPTTAVGPDALLDGIWFIQETGPGIGPPTFYASIHQNGSTVIAVLISMEGEWIYAMGTRSGSTVQGAAYTSDGYPYGSFNITATSPTSLTGSSTTQGITTPLVGTKVF